MCVHSSSVLDVLEDDGGQDESHQGVVPGHKEHEDQTEKSPHQGAHPVVVANPGPPIGGLQDGLEDTCKVHEHVADQEEPKRSRCTHCVCAWVGGCDQ